MTGEKPAIEGGLTPAGPEVTKKFPASARNANVAGLNWELHATL